MYFLHKALNFKREETLLIFINCSTLGGTTVCSIQKMLHKYLLNGYMNDAKTRISALKENALKTFSKALS